MDKDFSKTITEEPEQNLEQKQTEPANSIQQNEVQKTIINDSTQVQLGFESNPLLLPIRFAGFWMRFWAYLLDLIVIGSVNRIVINPVFRALDISLYESNMLAPMSIATAITFYVYFIFMTKYFGQTLGKMVFGLKVVNLDGTPITWNTVLFRELIGRYISVTIFVLYIIVAFLPKKQGIHDLFVDTSVIHKS